MTEKEAFGAQLIERKKKEARARQEKRRKKAVEDADIIRKGTLRALEVVQPGRGAVVVVVAVNVSNMI